MTHVLIYAVGCLALIALVLMGARYIEQRIAVTSRHLIW